MQNPNLRTAATNVHVFSGITEIMNIATVKYNSFHHLNTAFGHLLCFHKRSQAERVLRPP